MLSPESEFLLDMRAQLASLQREAKSMFAATPLEKLQERRDPPPYRRKFAGFDVMIENPKGSIRSGVSRKGRHWQTKMNHDYGYLNKANGEDGEGLDIFLGPDPKAANVYVVHQNDPETGKYDEDKLVVGVHSSAEAKALYLSNYDTPKFFRSVTEIPVATFKTMLTKAAPGSVHWKRKNARNLDTSAMFSADTTDLMMESARVLRELHALAFDDGEWITIGAKAGSDGKRHGGTPVKVGSGGEIDAGPKALKGRSIPSLKKNLAPAKNPHSMVGTQTGVDTKSLKDKFKRLGSPESIPVRVDDDLRTAAQLGRLTIPVHGGQIDPNLEDAYRRAAEQQGVKLGEFKIDPDGGHATAQIGDHGDDSLGKPQLSPELMEMHPLYDRATGDFIRHHESDLPEVPHGEPKTDEEVARAVNRGDLPVEKVLETHPELAGKAIVQQHQREKMEAFEKANAEEKQKEQAKAAPGGEPVAETPIDPKAALRERIGQLKAKGLPSERAVARARIELEKEGVLPSRTPNAPQAQQNTPRQPRQLDPELQKAQEQEQALAAKLREGKPDEQSRGSDPPVPTDGGDRGQGAGSVQGTEPDERVGQPAASEPPVPEAEPVGAGETAAPDEVGEHEANQPQPVGEGVPDSTAPEGNGVEREAAGKGPAKGKAPKAGRPLSKSAIERTLMAHLDETSGESERDIEDDKELASYPNPYTFMRSDKTKSGLPGEVEHFLEKGPGKRMRRLFEVTDDPAKAGGDDAMRGMKDYFGLVSRRGDMTGRVSKALEAAKNSPDPQIRLLAAIHETMPPAKERGPQESVKAAELQPGEEMRINGIPVEVKENEDGDRLLTDGGDIPDVPVDALDGLSLPVDKGSRHEKAVPEDLDPFGDIADEPTAGELNPNEQQSEPPVVHDEGAGEAGAVRAPANQVPLDDALEQQRQEYERMTPEDQASHNQKIADKAFGRHLAKENPKNPPDPTGPTQSAGADTPPAVADIPTPLTVDRAGLKREVARANDLPDTAYFNIPESRWAGIRNTYENKKRALGGIPATPAPKTTPAAARAGALSKIATRLGDESRKTQTPISFDEAYRRAKELMRPGSQDQKAQVAQSGALKDLVVQLHEGGQAQSLPQAMKLARSLLGLPEPRGEREATSSPPSTADVNKSQSANLSYRKPVETNAMDAMLDRRMARQNAQRFGKKPANLAQSMRQAIPKAAREMRQERKPEFSADVGKKLKAQVTRLQDEARKQGRNLPFAQAIKQAKQQLGLPVEIPSAKPVEPIRASRQLGLLGPQAGQEIGSLTGSQHSMFSPAPDKPKEGNAVDDRIKRQYDPNATGSMFSSGLSQPLEQLDRMIAILEAVA